MTLFPELPVFDPVEPSPGPMIPEAVAEQALNNTAVLPSPAQKKLRELRLSELGDEHDLIQYITKMEKDREAKAKLVAAARKTYGKPTSLASTTPLDNRDAISVLLMVIEQFWINRPPGAGRAMEVLISDRTQHSESWRDLTWETEYSPADRATRITFYKKEQKSK